MFYHQDYSHVNKKNNYEKHVSIWIGNFQNDEQLENYLLIEYLDNEDLPRSQFTKDFKIDYYDQDFQEAYCAGDFLSVENLIEPISYSETFINQIKSEDKNYNSLISVYKYKYDGKVKQNSNVFFLGVYEYEE